ncbi:MAG: acyl transferase [Chitinophagaceae bacterium]|nr:acyl transferase [Chitinophagaceae bacterium]
MTRRIFDFNISDPPPLALEVFHFQYANNIIYRQYCEALGIYGNAVRQITDIPFLPISFFKTHPVKTTAFTTSTVFESSGTTQAINSKHYIKDVSLYTESFGKTFELFYGTPANWCIIALLPSYLERRHSSLVVMADELIKSSGHPDSGFYLHDHKRLSETLLKLEEQQQRTLLLGVTFGLLDFAEKYPVPLQYTTIMETGGMKGRREEITREEVHDILKQAFGVKTIHSEYGMTELLSQAYSKQNGIFYCPSWMKVLMRKEDDPLTVEDNRTAGKVLNGVINVMDLANIYSCSFIATEDAGKLYPDGSFEVLGRVDNSDIRGCSLMVV